MREKAREFPSLSFRGVLKLTIGIIYLARNRTHWFFTKEIMSNRRRRTSDAVTGTNRFIFMTVSQAVI